MPHVDYYVTVTQAKAQLLDLIRQMQKRQEIVGITRDGVPTAVLLSREPFEGLMDTLDILSVQKTTPPLRKSFKRAKSARWETDASANCILRSKSKSGMLFEYSRIHP